LAIMEGSYQYAVDPNQLVCRVFLR
jgi:hypothetical protein